MRKRSKKPLPWRAILWTMFLGNTLAGLVLSPVTAVRTVRVVGAPQWDELRVQSILEGLKATPVLAIDVAKVETEVQAASSVDSARLSRTPFGSAKLEVVYRQPVARVMGSKSLFFCADGKTAEFLEPQTPAITVKLPEPSAQPVATLAGAWDFSGLANVCRKLENLPFAKDWIVEMNAFGSVFLQAGPVVVIEFGDTSKIDEKLDALAALFEDHHDLLDRVRSINVTAPARPMVVPLR